MEQVIIETLSNPLTFERFCAALISLEENTTITTTSSNYDRGVDAKSNQNFRQSYPLVLCVTLAKEIDTKIYSDILKLVKRTSPDAIYYCCSQRLTEDACIKLEAEIRNLLQNAPRVKVFGSIQLSQLAQKHPEVMANFYRAEMDSILAALQPPSDKLDKEARGLRLALLAFGSDEAEVLRQQMSQRLLMDVLLLGPKTDAEIAEKITSDIWLPKAMTKEHVRPLLHIAALQGLVLERNSKWYLTDQGKAIASGVPIEATVNLLEGRRIIRNSLEVLLGTPLTDLQYYKVWSTLLDGLSDLFFTNGIRVISALSSFLDTKDETTRTDRTLDEIAFEMGERIQAIFTSPDLKVAVKQAVKDIFTERNGAAFDWLSRVCERFVTLCSLGLESNSSAEINRLIKQTLITLDTDIALTYLAVGEPDHQSVKDFLTQFRKLGGRVMLSASVLEEVAYHAWISERDFKGTRFMLGKLKPEELRRYCENAFVRAFHSMASNDKEAEYWPDYVKQYRGASAYDYSKAQRELSRSLGAELLPEAIDPALQEAITREVLLGKRAKAGRNKQEESEIENLDKAKRDGRVMASVKAGRDSQAKLGTKNTVILLSSSGLLRSLALKFKRDFGAPEAVLSVGALSYLISLVPNANLGAETLRRALFEFGETGHLQDADRLALRVIRGTGLYKVPWATREMMSQRLEAVLYGEAKKRDLSPEQFRRSFAHGDSNTDPAAIIVKAVTNSSLQNELELEVHDLKKKLADMQLELEFVRKDVGKL